MASHRQNAPRHEHREHRRRRMAALIHGRGRRGSLMAYNFVLWHGGWCWRRVADRLRASGHLVFTPTLTGLGERSHLLRPDLDLDVHTADVINAIKWERLSDVVLCGHSY